jgi:hypothetical protein
MASSYTTNFGIEEMATGDQSGAWGTTTNYNFDILDRIASYTSVALSGTTHTLTVRAASPTSGSSNVQDGMYRVIKFTGALGANNTVTIGPNTSKAYFIFINATTDSGSSGPYSVILSQGSGANVTIANGKSTLVYCDGAGSGAAVVDALANLQLSSLIVNGTVTDDGATHDGDVTFTGASYNVVWDKSDNALEFADNAKATFGTGGDLSIYHDGSNSYINDTATGTLKLAASQVDILGGTDGAETMATFVDNGAVTLYHDNSAKLATSANGVTVTGAVSPTTGVTLADNVNLTLGTGSDATIDFSGYHLEIRQADDAQDTYFYDSSGNARLRLDTDQGDLYLYNYDSGTDGPNLIFNHPSSSPADSDTIGRLYFVADNSADENTYYSTVVVLSEDVTDGSEDGGIYLQALTDGTNKSYVTVNSSSDKAVTLRYDGSLRLNTTSAGVTITGAISKSSGSFLIDHPLESMRDTHQLAHSFIEGPQADLIYRGRVALSGGAATVDLDTAAGMTSGTFDALNGNVQCFTTNETGWDAVRGSVSGGTLTIQSRDASCEDTISWMVIGERKDQHMFDTGWTDEFGKVIVEPSKP